MTSTLYSAALAWLLTYAIHSTVLLLLAWGLTRWRRLNPSAAELLWKSAMIGSIVTATVQLQLDVRPTGTFSMGETVVTSAVSSPAPRHASRASDPVGIAMVKREPSPPDIAPTATVVAAADAPAARFTREALIVVAWALVALVLALSYAARRLILSGRIGDRTAIVDGPLFEMLGQLARESRMRSPPRLTCTPRISSPIALGVREICVPGTALTALDAEQQRSMLAHELAHLARRDPVWMALASLVERVLWIQPLNRLARRRIAAAAEYICDDWAVGRTGSGVALARCLAQVAEWIQASPLGVPVAGMAEERSLLVARVARLLEGARPATRSRRVLAVGTLVVLLATVVFAPGVSGRSASEASVTGSSLWAAMVQRSAPPNSTLRDSTKMLDREYVSDLSRGWNVNRGLTNAGSYARAVSLATADGRMIVDDSHRSMSPADSAIVVALIARLKDEDAEVRAAAAHSLGRLEDARAVPALIDVLKDSKPRVRAAAAEALGQFHDVRSIAPLVALLSDANADVKQNALEALSQYEGGVPSAGIVRLLDDADADIRHRAAHLLGQLHDRAASPALARLLHDSNADVRQAAIEALGELRDQAAVSAIVAALSDANAAVRGQALSTLSDLRAPIPEAALAALLRDPVPDVRGKAAELAGERSVVGAVPALRRLLEDANGDVRQHAVEALGNMADAAAYEALRSALTSKDPKVRRAAVEALGERRQ